MCVRVARALAFDARTDNEIFCTGLEMFSVVDGLSVRCTTMHRRTRTRAANFGAALSAVAATRKLARRSQQTRALAHIHRRNVRACNCSGLFLVVVVVDVVVVVVVVVVVARPPLSTTTQLRLNALCFASTSKAYARALKQQTKRN